MEKHSVHTEREEIRVLPKNIEAEQIIIGSALLDPQGSVPLLLEKIAPDDFYYRRHRIIFRTVRELFERGDPADIVVLANRLEEKKELDDAGGRAYLRELLDRVVTTASIEYYAEIVRKKATLRALIEAGGRISELGYDEITETEEVLDRAESYIFDISSHHSVGTYQLVSDFLYDHIGKLEELHRDPNRHTITGISTGFPKLDEMTSGLQPSDLIIFAGRPGTGKTSLALTIARNAAVREKSSVGIFSLEMSKEQILERLLCGEGKVSLHRLRGGYVPAAKWRDVAYAASNLQKSRIMIDDSPGMSILDIRARARRMSAQYGLDLIVVDYIQLIEAKVSGDVREQQISHISRSLKHLARELNVPVIALSQLNRAVEQRPNKRPILADLRESGAIEQDADMVVFIYREDYYTQPNEESATPAQGAGGEAEIIIGKQRNGPLGTTKVIFHKAYASFYPITWDDAGGGS